MLLHLIKSLGIEKKVKQYEVLNKWPQIVGEKIASVSSVEKIRDGILFVRVKNNVWRNELLFLKNKIKKNIEEEIGSGIIKDIIFI